jgi:hypothetical protein
MMQYSEFFTIQRDEWKQVTIKRDPLDQPLLLVFRNGLKQRPSRDYSRPNLRAFYFPFVTKDDLIEIMYYSAI